MIARLFGEGEAPAEPGFSSELRLGRSLALPKQSRSWGIGGTWPFLWHGRPARVPEALNAKPTFELQNQVSRLGFSQRNLSR